MALLAIIGAVVLVALVSIGVLWSLTNVNFNANSTEKSSARNRQGVY